MRSMNIRPFFLLWQTLLARLVALQGCQSGHTGTYEHALCMMIEKLAGIRLFYLNTSCKPFRVAPAAGRAEPPVVRRAVRSVATKSRQREDKGLCS